MKIFIHLTLILSLTLNMINNFLIIGVGRNISFVKSQFKRLRSNIYIFF